MSEEDKAALVFRLGLFQGDRQVCLCTLRMDAPIFVRATAQGDLSISLKTGSGTLLSISPSSGPPAQLRLVARPGCTGALREGDRRPPLHRRPEDGALDQLLGPLDRGRVDLPGGFLLFAGQGETGGPAIDRRAFRPRLLDEDDPRFLGLLTATASAAAALMVWVLLQRPVELVRVDELPQQIAAIQWRAAPAPEPLPPAPERLPAEPGLPLRAEPGGDRAAVDVAPADHGLARNEARVEAVRRSALFMAIGADRSGVFSEGDESFAAVALDLPDLHAELGSPAGQGPMLRGGAQPLQGDRGIGGLSTSRGRETAAIDEISAPAPQRGRLSAAWQGSPDPDDPADAELIREVVGRGAPQLQACYTQRLKEQPTLEGRLAVQLDIVRGRVLRVDIAENGTGDATLADCVSRRVRAWRFPAEVTAQAVYLPFALVPG